jgi:hypothetical protein
MRNPMDIGAAVAYGSHKVDKPMELESIKRAVVTASHVFRPPRFAAAFGHAATIARGNGFARAGVRRD